MIPPAANSAFVAAMEDVLAVYTRAHDPDCNTHTKASLYEAFPAAEARAFTLAQGLLVITAALPTAWKVRFVDENMGRADVDNLPGPNRC